MICLRVPVLLDVSDPLPKGPRGCHACEHGRALLHRSFQERGERIVVAGP